MMRTAVKSTRRGGASLNSLVVEIPEDFAVEHGLPARSLATLDFDSMGRVTSEVIAYDEVDQNAVEEFLREFPQINEGMKAIGD